MKETISQLGATRVVVTENLESHAEIGAWLEKQIESADSLAAKAAALYTKHFILANSAALDEMIARFPSALMSDLWDGLLNSYANAIMNSLRSFAGSPVEFSPSLPISALTIQFTDGLIERIAEHVVIAKQYELGKSLSVKEKN